MVSLVKHGCEEGFLHGCMCLSVCVTQTVKLVYCAEKPEKKQKLKMQWNRHLWHRKKSKIHESSPKISEVSSKKNLWSRNDFARRVTMCFTTYIRQDSIDRVSTWIKQMIINNSSLDEVVDPSLLQVTHITTQYAYTVLDIQPVVTQLHKATKYHQQPVHDFI